MKIASRATGTIGWAAAIAGVIFAVIWLLSVVVSGFSAPSWVPPAGLMALGVALVLP